MILVGIVWFFIGVAWFIGLAVGRDSVPGASLFDGAFILFYVVWGGIFLGIIIMALSNLWRSVQPSPRKPSSELPSQFVQTQGLATGATPDERLAPLLKKENQDGAA